MMHKLYNIASILIPKAEYYENTMSVLKELHLRLAEIQLFFGFQGPPDHIVSIKDGPWLINKTAKVWRLLVWLIYPEKTGLTSNFASI